MPFNPGILQNEQMESSLVGYSKDKSIGVLGLTDSVNGFGVRGECNSSIGFLGGNDPQYKQHVGAYGESDQQGVFGHSTANNGTGVYGNSVENGFAIRGENASSHGFIAGIDPKYQQHTGVYGASDQLGIYGHSTSDNGTGVYGNSINNGFAIRGENASTNGFIAGIDPKFNQHIGVYGSSDQLGVYGHSTVDTGTGIYGDSIGKGIGVRGETTDGIAIKGVSFGGGVAGRFEGNVEITGSINAPNCTANLFDVIISGADVAEDFSVADSDSILPGYVMTFNEDGSIEACNNVYDKKVAGVISGAGDYRPGLVLDKQKGLNNRMPIALMGKVFCYVDADLGAINIGDMLTTSSTHGHAMKVQDPFKAFGAVIGKALKPLLNGKGLIPVLVTLQ